MNSIVSADAIVVISASPKTKTNLCCRTSYLDLKASCPTEHCCFSFTALFSIGDNFHNWCFLQLPVRPNWRTFRPFHRQPRWNAIHRCFLFQHFLRSCQCCRWCLPWAWTPWDPMNDLLLEWCPRQRRHSSCQVARLLPLEGPISDPLLKFGAYS